MLSIDAIDELFFVFRRRRFVSNNDAVVFDVLFLNFVVRFFEVSRGPFRNFVFGWTSDGEVSRGWFRLLVFEVSRGRIRNLIFDVQKLDRTSGGEVSRGRFRFVCVYDFRIPHQVRKAL